MAEAVERLSRRDDEDATGSAEEAAERLERAREEAERAAALKEERLARELLETSAGAVSALAERQGGVNEEVLRLDGLKGEAGRLSRSQSRTLRQTAEVQRAVGLETASLADRLGGAAAVALALRSAAGRMALAADSLDGNEVGGEPQRHGAAAKETLDRVAAALRPGPPGPSESSPQAGEEGPPGETVPLLAQLELLKGLQEDLLRRTEAFDARPPDSTQVGDGELSRLGSEQAALADLFRQLVEEAPGRGESEP
jgi:hypothetical protein